MIMTKRESRINISHFHSRTQALRTLLHTSVRDTGHSYSPISPRGRMLWPQRAWHARRPNTLYTSGVLFKLSAISLHRNRTQSSRQGRFRPADADLESGNSSHQPRPDVMTQEEIDLSPISVVCPLRFLERIRGVQRGGCCLAP
jgi:hypothetical protein